MSDDRRMCPRLGARCAAVAVLGLGLLAGCTDDAPRAANRDGGAATSSPSSSTSGASRAPPAAQDGGATEWLYVVDADGGTASQGTVTLTQLDQDAIAFSDRPQRVARRLPVAELVSGWTGLGFTDDPPNATIAYQSGGRERAQAVELTDPVLDGDRLTFSYVALDPAAPAVPTDLGPASVFIDDAGDPATPLATVTAATEEQFADICLRNRSQYVVRGPVTVCQRQLRTTPQGQDPYVQWDVYVEVQDADNFEAFVDIDVLGDDDFHYTIPLKVEGALAEISWQSPVIPAADSLGTSIAVSAEAVSPPVQVQCRTRWDDVLEIYDGSCSMFGSG